MSAILSYHNLVIDGRNFHITNHPPKIIITPILSKILKYDEARAKSMISCIAKPFGWMQLLILGRIYIFFSSFFTNYYESFVHEQVRSKRVAGNHANNENNLNLIKCHYLMKIWANSPCWFFIAVRYYFGPLKQH